MTALVRLEGLVIPVSIVFKSLCSGVNESMAKSKIISSLPKQCKHFISAWESMPAEQRKMDELASRLLVEEQRFNGRVEEEGSSSST
ncbi:hypothetical protein PR048_017871 [Dryococelus australis]|uniref:Uncharacterized protein n=1 Tax=Dryococelus australis TaxID=614101 RepID=A0ABQ9HAU5_9NEOP|nr:hypothetical protein PR048_017871 [Dryococelus australis]